MPLVTQNRNAAQDGCIRSAGRVAKLLDGQVCLVIALEDWPHQRDQLLHRPGNPLAAGGQQPLEIVLGTRHGLVGHHGAVGQQLGKLLTQVETRKRRRVKLHLIEVRQPIHLRLQFAPAARKQSRSSPNRVSYSARCGESASRKDTEASRSSRAG